MVSEQALQRFKEIYHKRFNENLSDQEATEIAMNFLALFKLVYENKNSATCISAVHEEPGLLHAVV